MRRGIVLLVTVLAVANSGCTTMGFSNKTAAFIPDSGLTTGFVNKTILLDGKQHRYVVYVPFEYTPDKPWPFILFLHGAGERGSDGLIQSEVGIGTAIRRYSERFPAIVAMPQCPKDSFWNAEVDLMEGVMEKTLTEYTIDKKRMYLTGLSMGGFGTWIWGATKTDTFAAMMPICGGGHESHIKNLAKKKPDRDFGTYEERVQKLATVPIWAFHGADDDVVPPRLSREMVEDVKEAGGTIKYTEFADTGHDSWVQAYQHRAAIKWLFKQKK